MLSEEEFEWIAARYRQSNPLAALVRELNYHTDTGKIEIEYALAEEDHIRAIDEWHEQIQRIVNYGPIQGDEEISAARLYQYLTSALKFEPTQTDPTDEAATAAQSSEPAAETSQPDSASPSVSPNPSETAEPDLLCGVQARRVLCAHAPDSLGGRRGAGICIFADAGRRRMRTGARRNAPLADPLAERRWLPCRSRAGSPQILLDPERERDELGHFRNERRALRGNAVCAGRSRNLDGRSVRTARMPGGFARLRHDGNSNGYEFRESGVRDEKDQPLSGNPDDDSFLPRNGRGNLPGGNGIPDGNADRASNGSADHRTDGIPNGAAGDRTRRRNPPLRRNRRFPERLSHFREETPLPIESPTPEETPASKRLSPFRRKRRSRSNPHSRRNLPFRKNRRSPSEVPTESPEPSETPPTEDQNPDDVPEEVPPEIEEAERDRSVDWRGAVESDEPGLPIPLLFQGDYPEIVLYYNGIPKSVATSGCGATSISMVIAYLTGNTDQNPYTLFCAAVDDGRYHGNGLSHRTLQWLAEQYGVYGKWIEGSESAIINALNAGIPVIAHMGEGAFTEKGHYIVLRGLTEDGKVLVGDPASHERSHMAFPISSILDQARVSDGFMVCTLGTD